MYTQAWAVESVGGSLFASGIIGSRDTDKIDLRMESAKHRRSSMLFATPAGPAKRCACSRSRQDSSTTSVRDGRSQEENTVAERDSGGTRLDTDFMSYK